ncbi:SMC-Scp complex subunit ScpB [Hydromonas duriensis]|uniref:Segregation and condensation protein B n=1 Tax=Hydromonas duriensis TaxID=1527608 RepID=A0A4R6Y6X3_9BURK|nr:SMC-Scp complex subunit ScpB [Hydromonas duriensis]TDR29048.1 segregation and condensation protein B [Hydromonas duriensis]
MILSELKRIIEALILCHDAPMSLAQIRQSLDSDLSNEQLRALLDEIALEWQTRAVHLVQVATGWCFQSAPDLIPYLDRMRAEKPASYSRAVLETLAIIAYKQPVTRGDIEDIRGVTVSSEIIKKLEDRGWVDVVGHREVPGRPALLATTKQFLDDLGLQHVRDLPPLLAEHETEVESQLSLDGIKPLTERAQVGVLTTEEAQADSGQLTLVQQEQMHTESATSDLAKDIDNENYLEASPSNSEAENSTPE